MKTFVAGLALLTLAVGVRADLIQLTTGKSISGRVLSYADDIFEIEPTNAPPLRLPANSVASIDFSHGAVKATVDVTGQEMLVGKIWLYSRGALNFDNDKGETTRIPLTKISNVTFSADPIPDRPAPPPDQKPAGSSTASKPTIPKLEVITHGDEVDIKKHCVPGKITIVDFYADWCGPCRQAGPILEDRVNNDPDLVLRKVDIVKWGSPVSQQYKVNGIPYIQVYDRQGNKVGDLTGFNKAKLESYLTSAR